MQKFIEFVRTHRKKSMIAFALVGMFFWNYIIGPVAAFYGLTLPPITIEQLRAVMLFVVGI